METSRTARRLWLSWPRLALLLLWAAPGVGAEPTAEPPPPLDPRAVWIASPGGTSPDLQAMAAGYTHWLRHRIADAGLQPLGGEIAELRAPLALSLDRASAAGAAYLLAPELRRAGGEVEVALPLYDAAAGELTGLTRARAPLARVGLACEESLAKLLPRLGATPGSIPIPHLDELAASGRALLAWQQGRLGSAWEQVAGRHSPTAERLREALRASADRPEAPPFERALVLLGAGQPDAAWALIAEAVEREADATAPRVERLVVGAEVQLGRRKLRAAQDLLDAALAADPGNARAQLVLGRLLLRRDPDGARRALEASARLDPGDPRPLVLLADLERAAPARRAELLLAAGRLAAGELNVHRAQRYFEQAGGLDPRRLLDAWRESGELAAEVGLRDDALSAFRRIADAGAARGSDWIAIARLERAAGEHAAAEAALESALALDPQSSDALLELGELYTATGRAAEAVSALRRVSREAPESARARRALAEALQGTGALQEARQLLAIGAGAVPGADTSATLLRLAAIEREQRDYDAAHRTLRRAIALDPHNPALHEELARVYRDSGDEDAALRVGRLALHLTGEKRDWLEEPRSPGRAASFEQLAASFDGEGVLPERAVFLGVRPSERWGEVARRWLQPRTVDPDAVASALAAALARRGEVAPAPRISNAVLARHVDALFDFEREASLDANAIATVNQALETDAVFVGVLRAAPAELPSGSARCPADRGVEVELRLLSGRRPEQSAILTNAGCLDGSGAGLGRWNARAAAVYLLLLAALAYPFVRGWGNVVVTILLPAETSGFLSLRVARRQNDLPLEKRPNESFLRSLRREMRRVSRYERRMVGRETAFRWIPARKRTYAVTVRGPLLDADGERVIGHFLEQQRVAVRRGQTTRVEFDFRPTECAVELRALWGGRPARGAALVLRGETGSQRYVREKISYLYLGKGRHTLLLGERDRVASVDIEIHSLTRAIPLTVDLEDESQLVFRGCPLAVGPYMEGNLEAAASALAVAGDAEAAHRVRAEHLREIGDLEGAARELQSAGSLEEAAELRAEGSDYRGSAELFERAGDVERAADTYRAAGELAAAARCYESAHRYDEALDCYRSVGDMGKVLELLEKNGSYLEAGSVARERGDETRAIRNLRQLGSRDDSYPDGCVLLAEIHEQRGELEPAADKLQDALRTVRGGMAPIDWMRRYAEVCARAGRTEQAIDAYAELERREPENAEFSAKLAALRSEHEAAATQVGDAPDRGSRYELLDVIGRGGMGVVYKARDKRLNRMVALKRLPENLRDHPAATALFRREAQAAAALNHRNIVTLFDADEEKGIYFITMELLEGRPLGAILRQGGRLRARAVAAIGCQACAGLQYASERRIVHRDIKTANLFLTSDRVVKIMDFGLAKTLEEVRRRATFIGGTPTHMAPEQAAGDAVDHRTDLYSLGVTLFELLTADLPFIEGDLAYHHRHTAPPDPRDRCEGIPDALAELVLQMMAKQPNDRPASAREVAARLQTLLS